MYFVSVLALMFLLPLASVIQSAVQWTWPEIAALVLHWVSFWSVGVRLVVAGVRQVFGPSFTAREVFRIQDASAFPIVRELGYANVAIGLIAFCAHWQPAWRLPAAIAGAIFLGLAGMEHLMNNQRTAKSSVAMLSDLIVSAVLAAACVYTFFS